MPVLQFDVTIDRKGMEKQSKTRNTQTYLITMIGETNTG